MQARPALRRLLNNPLLLRLSAEYYARSGRVAENRAALYGEWVEEAWRRAEARGANADQKGTALRALEALAWHRQTGGSSQEEALLSALERAGLPDPEGWLRLLREKAGLLARFPEEREGRVVNTYLFAHQTVQEYFVARRLAHAWGANPRRTLAFLRPRLHLPEWREPLALLVGLLPEEQAALLLHRIRRARSPYERRLRRDLLLAAELAHDGGRREPARADLLPALLQALRDGDWWVRRAAEEALGRIGDPQALPALTQALRDEDAGVRRAAARALGKIGDPQALPALHQALRDEEAKVRWVAAVALQEALALLRTPAEPKARRALQRQLRQVRRMAVKQGRHGLLAAALQAEGALQVAASSWTDPLQPSPGEVRRRKAGRAALGAAAALLLGLAGPAGVLLAGAQDALKDLFHSLLRGWSWAALAGLAALLAALGGLLGWAVEGLRGRLRR
jgi:hypothetical protein